MTTPHRRWIAAAGVLFVSVGSLAVAGRTAHAVPGPGQVELTFLNINDFHGRIEATTPTASGITVRLALLVEQQRAAAGEATTALLSAGDNIGATLFASAMAQDQPTIDVLNAMDVVASAVGNHELDQGMSDLTGRVIGGNGPNAPVEFPYLAANIYDTATGEAVLDEYTTFDMAGLTVGVIGAVTAETPGLVSPGGIVGLTFGDPVDAVNRVADQLTDGDEANGEADILVAEYHEGAAVGTPASTLELELAKGGTFEAIVNETSADVDVIFTAHTHQSYAWNGAVPGETGRTRPVVQTGSYGDNLGRVVLTVDETTGDVAAYTATNVARASSTPALIDAATLAAYPRVAAVKSIVDAAGAAAAVVGNVPVGTVTADITTAFAGGTYTNGVYTGGTRDDRARESTLGNLVADSLVATLSDPLRGGATIGVVNPGGLRAELFYAADPTKPGVDVDGRVLFSEANGVLPFVNNLWTVDLTGAQFKTMLEQQWQRLADGTVPTSRPYLQLGLSRNVTYTFDPALPEGSRITSITVDGAPMDPVATYRVGAFSFLVQGGDNFHVFRQGTNVRDSGLIDRDAWIEYITASSPLTPDFSRQSVQVTPLPTTASVGQTLSLGVAGLDLTSRGAPQNSSLAVSIGGTALGDVPVTSGAATIALVVPPGTPTGAQDLVLLAGPSGTTVTIPVTVSDTRIASMTTLTRSAASQVFGGPKTVTLTARVALADSSTPPGSVEFVGNGVVLASVTLVNGVARYTLPADTPAATYSIMARYADTNEVKASSSAALRVTVKKATSTTRLSTSRPVHRPGHPAVLTARVTLNSAAVATGLVEFRVNGFVVGVRAGARGQGTQRRPPPLGGGR
jgi:5'-nucleotidase